VDTMEVVSGVNPGNVVIKAVSAGNKNKLASCTVTLGEKTGKDHRNCSSASVLYSKATSELAGKPALDLQYGKQIKKVPTTIAYVSDRIKKQKTINNKEEVADSAFRLSLLWLIVNCYQFSRFKIRFRLNS